VVVRELLASGRTHEALPAATELMQRSDGAPTARVLLAAASLANDDPGAAAEALAEWPDTAALAVYDRLVLARVWMNLEAWDRLATALQPVREVPPTLQPEHSFLVAVSLARVGRTVEALALLDALAAPTEAPGAATVWPAPAPSRYEIEVWRGVALALARKADAARDVLRSAAELDPGRPEAQYQLGLLEARAGRPEIATAHLKNAVAASERFAPAWEAWAVLELDGGQVNPALEHVGRAVTINPRRASAHFLTAIAYAKLSRETQAAEALRAAAHLDPHYLEQAKQTEVLLRLFTPAEMEALVAAGDADAPAVNREPETRP
jgi:tetratricopeptide (TPR) repeat protein